MEAEALTNLLLGMGVPGIVIIVVVWLTKTYAPQAIKVYQAAKEKEQEAFQKRQDDYRQQSERIVEVAATATEAIKQATAVMEQNREASQAVISGLASIEKTLAFVRENFANHDRLTENVRDDVKLVLENSRKN